MVGGGEREGVTGGVQLETEDTMERLKIYRKDM